MVTKLIDDTMRLYRHNKKPDIVARAKQGAREIDYGKTENYTPDQSVRLVFRDNIAEYAIAHSDRVFRFADLTLDQYHSLILDSKDPYSLSKLLCNGLDERIANELSLLNIKVNSIDTWYENDGNIIAIGAQSTQSQSPHLLELIRDPRFAATSLIEFDFDSKQESFTPRRLTHRSGHSQCTAMPVKKQLAETVIKLANNPDNHAPTSTLLNKSDPIEYDQTSIYDPELAKLSPTLALDQANLYTNSFANPAASELCKLFNLAEITVTEAIPSDLIKLVKLNGQLHQLNHFHPDAKPLNTDYWAKTLLALTGQPAYKATEPEVGPDVTNALQMALVFNNGLPYIQRLIDKTRHALSKKELSSDAFAQPDITDITHNSDLDGNLSLDDVFAILLKQQMTVTEETNNAKKGHAIANVLALAVGPLRDATEGLSNDAAATLLALLMSGSQVSNINSTSAQEAGLIAQSKFTTAGSRTVVNEVGIINNEVTFRHQPDDPVTFMEILSKYDNPELYLKLIRIALNTTKDENTGEYKLWELDQGDINAILWLKGRFRQSQALSKKTQTKVIKRIFLNKQEQVLLRKFEQLIPIDIIENQIIQIVQQGQYDEVNDSKPSVFLTDKQKDKLRPLVAKYCQLTNREKDEYLYELENRVRDCFSIYQSEVTALKNDQAVNQFLDPDFNPTIPNAKNGLAYLGTKKDTIYAERRKRLLSLDAYDISRAFDQTIFQATNVNLDSLTLGDEQYTNLSTAIEAANKDSKLKTELLLVANRVANTLTELGGSKDSDRQVVEDIRSTYKYLITHRAISTNVDTAIQIIGHTAFYIQYLVGSHYGSDVLPNINGDPAKTVQDISDKLSFNYNNPNHYKELCQQAREAGVPPELVTNHIFNLVLAKTNVLPWIRDHYDSELGFLPSLARDDFKPKPIP